MSKKKVTLNLSEEVIEEAKIYVIKSRDYNSLSHFVDSLLREKLAHGCHKGNQ